MFCTHGYELVKMILPQVTTNYLEIGVFNGDSIGNLGKLFPDRTIIGCDPFIEDGCTISSTGASTGDRLLTQRENTRNNITGLNNVIFYEMKSTSLLSVLSDKMIADLNVGVVMIDGDHSIEHAMIDLILAMKLIGNKEGFIILDDYSADTGVKFAAREFERIFGDRIAQVHLSDVNVPLYQIRAVNENI